MAMASVSERENGQLNLRAGELIEVKSLADILLTLDPDGKCAGLPFMPEMLGHCGKRYRVFKRADKTCDNIKGTWMIRRMYDTVLLENIRCDGNAHDGCQAGCMVFWKEAWLKRAGEDAVIPIIPLRAGGTSATTSQDNLISIEAADSCPDVIRRNTVNRCDSEASKGEKVERYCCQATELYKCTDPLSPGDLRQYARDILTGNVGLDEFLKGIAVALFNLLQKKRKACIYPHVQGTLRTTPKYTSNLQIGETVRVKSLDEITQTLDTRNRNRGLLFDLEQAGFCGGTFRVAKRVEKIINESTGEMLKLPNDCIILDGVSCKAQVHGDRLFCPRRIYSYWREAWLERVEHVNS